MLQNIFARDIPEIRDDVHYEAGAVNELYGGGKYDDPGDGHNWYDDDCWMPQ